MTDVPNAQEQSPHDRNAEIAAPMTRLRKDIAKRWERISELLRDLRIKEKPKLTEKILSAEAASDKIRAEIKRILDHDSPERPKRGELVALLAATEKDVTDLQRYRDQLFTENAERLVNSFLGMRKYKNYHADTLDQETRKSIGLTGVLEAADEFNPGKGEFSTWAYSKIEHSIKDAAYRERKHTKGKIEKRVDGENEQGSLLDIAEDHRAERAEVGAQRTELVAELRRIMTEMPAQWRRALELTCGLGTDRQRHTPANAANIMNEEGLRTLRRDALITSDKVAQWVKQAKRDIARKMNPSFSQKTVD